MSFVRTGHRARLLAAFAATSVLALGLAACGDDDDEGSTEPVTEVTLVADEVSEDEFSFDLSATPTEDTERIVFDNQGEESHALIFGRLGEGFTVDEAFELEGRKGSAVTLVEDGARPGESKTFEITEPIEPGSYIMACPIQSPNGPHYKLGQLEEFDIG